MAKEITLNFQLSDGSVRTVDARVGDTIMETAIKNDIDDVVAECGGSLICATCHVYISDETAALIDEADDSDPNDRVHHHARVGDEHPPFPDGSFMTLCGVRIHRRPGAGKLPCCPMCALAMGKPCR